MNFITKRIRQIFFMNQMLRKVVAGMLAFCMVFTTMFSNAMLVVSADDGTGNVNLSGFSVTIDGKSLEEAGRLADGQKLKIDFTWNLSNDDKESTTFIANITPLQNIVLVNYPEANLEVEGYGIVGTYSIIGNVFTIKLNKDDGGSGKEFYDSFDRNGWAHIYGTIKVDDQDAEDGEKVPYSIGTATGDILEGEFEYDKVVTESTLGVQKWADGNVQKVGDGYQQKFRVKVNASNGEVSGINLTDTMGTGLSNLSNVKIVETNSDSFNEGDTYNDLNTPFSGKSLQANEYVVLEYTVDVDSSIYSSNADWTAYKNKIKAEYTDNLSQEKEVETDEVSAQVNRPSVSKTGKIPEGQQYVEWVITIRLNDLKDDASFQELVTSIIDTPGAGLVGQGTPVVLDPSKFTENPQGSGQYTFTYKTDVTDDYYGSVSKLNVKNEVKATIGENEYTASASAQTPGVADIISKAVVEDSFDEETGLLKWTVTIDTSKFPYDEDTSDGDDNIKGLTICDYASDVGGEITGSHTVNGASNVQIWVDGVKVVENGNIVDEDGNPVKDQWGNSISNGIIDSCTGYYTQDIKINDEYLLNKVKTDTPITVTFQSYVKDADRSGKIYQNTAYAKYVDPVTDAEATTPTVAARWEDTTVFLNAIEKVGVQVAGENSIAYTVKVNMANVASLTTDKNIVLEDVLPDNMVYDEGSFKLSDYYKDTWNYYEVGDWIYNQSASFASYGSATAYEDAGVNKIKIVIPVTDAMIRLGEHAKNNYSAEHYLHMTYTTTVEDAKTFLANGVATAFVNSISGKIGNDTIGEDSSTTVLTPQNIVSKGGVYDQTTCPNVKYSVEVNPQALDLSDGSLTAVDKIGSALSFNLDSIKVYENVDGAWVELSNGYSYTRNLAENSITFTLPDSKWLKIEYTAKVLLAYSNDPEKNGQLTAENAFNTFELSGMQESVGGSSVQTVSAVIEPAVGAEATTGSIKLWKYWGESGSAHPLDGCTFNVYETTYDEDSATYSVNESIIFKDNIVVNEDGEVTIYRLEKDKVYALVEMEAKEGYKLNSTPYYFVIPSTEAKKTEFEATNANVYTGTAPTLPFENEVDDAKGIIKLGKDVSGLSFDAAKTYIEFEITGPNEYSKTITGDQLTEYGNVITIADLEPGEYTITETKRSVDGYNCTQTTYKVNAESAVSGTTTDAFGVKQNETTSVTFYNTYEQIKGSLKLAKTVTGTPQAPDFEAVQNNLSFMITGPNGYSRVVAGNELDENDHSIKIDDLVPGTYKIVETVGLVTGYSRVETENVVTVPGNTGVTTDGITAENVEVVSDEVTTVDYTNDYEADKGSIRISKSSSGLTFDQIKGDISFVITGPGEYSRTVTGEELVEPGNSLEIGGLDPGTYKIVETATAPTGYTLYTTTYSVSTVDNGVTKTGTDTGEFELSSGDIIEVKFDNAYEHKRGSLKISKTVAGAGLSFGDVDDSLIFVINGPGYHAEILGTQLTQTGNSYVIDNLTPGVYTITEKNSEVEGYSLIKVTNVVAEVEKESAEAEFTISSDVTTEVEYTNTYEYGKGSIYLKKTSSGADFSEIKNTLEYTITGPNNYSRVITGAELVEAGNAITIGGLTPGEYTITESKHTDSDKYAYKTTVFRVNGGTNQQGDSASNITLEAGKILEVEFTNTYDLILGRMKLTKNVAMSGSGSITLDDVRSSLKFRITGPYNYNKTFTGADLTDGGNALILTDLVPGTYIITEETTELDDYNLIRTEYVKNAASVNGKIATVTVAPSKSENEVTVIDFNNLYEKKKGSLKLVKTVTGDAQFDDIKSAISFEISGPDGYTRTVTGSELTQAGNSLTINNLPIGDYTIVETVDDVTGYTYVSTVNSVGNGEKTAAVAIAADTLSTVEFTNEYNTATPEKGEIVITKTIIGDEVDIDKVKASLEFVVTNNATGASATYDLNDFIYNDVTGKYTLTLEKTPGGYTVKETATTIGGYKVTVKSSVGGGVLAEGAQQIATVEDQGIATVDFENDYTKLVGSLKLTKTLAGGVSFAEVKDKISFLITGPEGYSKTVKGVELDENTLSLTIGNLPIGTYTIVESAEDTDDYKYVSTVNSADNGKTTARVSVEEDTVSEITFTNTYSQKPGTLVITKTIKGDVTKEEAEGAITFTVTSNTDPSDSVTYTLEQFDYDEQTGVYTLRLEKKAGGYTVEETTHDIAGNEVTVKYSVDGGQQVADDTASVTLEAGEETQVDFENDYTKLVATLTVLKTIINLTPGDVIPEDRVGSIKFRITNVDTQESKTYTLKDDFVLDNVYNPPAYKMVLTVVPGTYMVEEIVTDIEGYDHVSVRNMIAASGYSENNSTSGTGTVSNNGNMLAHFTNEYEKHIYGSLILKKNAEGAPLAAVKDDLSFTVKGPDNYQKVIYGSMLDENGEYKITELEPGDYTVVETVATTDGYECISTKVQVGQTESEDVTTQIAVVGDETATVTFTNQYKQLIGKLVITKTINGDVTKEEAEGALQFEVTNTETGESEVYTLKDFEYDEETGTYRLELTVPSGTYTVEETIYDIKGYITSSVKYKVGTGEYEDGTTATTEVETDEVVNVDFEDVYEKNEGKLVLTKSVKGDLIWDDVKDSLSFVVKNKATGEKKTYKAAAFTDADGDGRYELIIDGLEPGEYTVTEKLDDVKGYMLETTYRVDGGSKQVGTKASVTLTKDGVQLDFVNTYTSTRGKLYITKTLLGNINRKKAEAALEFKVTNEQTGKSKTYTLEDFKYNKETGKYELELVLESGKYTVTETQYDVKGYELRSVTYTIGDGEKVEGDSAKVRVKAGKTTKVAFADRYIKKRTSDSSDTPDDPSAPNTPQTPPTTTTTDRKTPDTGDETPLMLWLAMLLLGVCGIGGSVYGLRREKKK